MKSIGIDIGGTKIHIAVIDDGLVIDPIRVKTNPMRGGTKILSEITGYVTTLINKHTECNGIGIGTAGQVSKDGCIRSATNTFQDWIGINLKTHFENYFKLPVEVYNDVQAMVLGEAFNDNESTLVVALGTGVGGGYYHNRLERGSSGSFAEIGHMVLVPNGRRCPCGNNGCAEAYLSGTALEKNANATLNQQIAASILLKEDNNHTKQYINYLCIFLTSLVNLYNLDNIILSGGVSQSLHRFLPSIQKTVQTTVLKSNASVKIRISNLNSEAILLGATSSFRK